MAKKSVSLSEEETIRARARAYELVRFFNENKAPMPDKIELNAIALALAEYTNGIEPRIRAVVTAFGLGVLWERDIRLVDAKLRDQRGSR